jgi:hypothetical protein
MSRNVRGFIAEVLLGNQPMLQLVQHAPGNVTTSRDENVMHVTVVFADRAKVRVCRL